MATYGMKDAANLTLVSKRTGDVALFLDYANATSSEWTSERVEATAKGTTAISWDSARKGTLTVDSEIFDLGYLAMVIGSEVKKGQNDILKREVVTVDATRVSKIEGVVDPSTVSLIKLKKDLVEHDGLPVVSTTGNKALLPSLVKDVVVNVDDVSANITFAPSDRAVSYDIKRDGVSVGTVTDTTFADTGLTAEQTYVYTIVAVNEFGTAAPSAKVTATALADGVKERVQFKATSGDIEAAEAVEGVLGESINSMVTYGFEDGKITFNSKAKIGDNYAVYYMESIDNARTIEISADKFPDSYEIFADAMIREKETGADEFVQIHYKNARPQSNFTLTQSATEPTSLSVVFDLVPDKNQQLAEMKFID